MKKALLLILTTASFFACKKPEACIQVSNENPKVNEYISISGDCSTKAKWYDFEIDGSLVSSDSDSNFEYSFKSAGNHLIKLTVYKKWTGSYNSRTGCSGCQGAGKSNTITKTIVVTN